MKYEPMITQNRKSARTIRLARCTFIETIEGITKRRPKSAACFVLIFFCILFTADRYDNQSVS